MAPDIQSHSLAVTRTAHYYTLGRPGPRTRHWWIACHGYGQLAARFIRKFDQIAGEDTFVLAPEGLSRFYVNGFSGEVGASWMTSADRLEEIADYARYLQGLHEYFRPMMPNVRAINLLGFSQGCATQVRWIMSAFPRFDHLVLWAGALPEDLDYRPHLHYFQEKRLFTVYGHADPFLTPDRLAMLQQYIERSGLTFHTLAFEGGHTIDRPTLARLKALLDPDSPEYENFP